MFSLSRKPKTTQNPFALQSDENAARIVIAENGTVVHASPEFSMLAGLKPGEDFTRIKAARVLAFENPSQNLAALPPGLQTITLKETGRIMDFHFDWLTTPDRRRYLVGSAAGAAHTETLAVTQEFEGKILQADPDLAAPDLSSFAPHPTITARADLEMFSAMARDIMVVTNDLGEIQQANQAFYELFGMDTPPRDFIDLFHDDDKPYIRNTIQALSFDGEEHQDFRESDFEARVKTPDGTERWMEWRQRQQGGTMYCLGQDVTPIKQQQQALGRREKQLLEAESIGRMGHWSWTVGAEQIEWSPEIFRIFGLKPKDFSPTLESMNERVHRADRGRVNQAFQRAIIEQNDYDMEFRILRPDGEIRYIRCEGRCACDSEDEVIALYGVMQDMTERMLYERQLKEAKDAAERAYAAKSQFLANMSHELRTPLNAIIGFSEMMQRQLLGPIGTPKYIEYIAGIRESGEHLLDLISDILDMSKIEAGKYELDIEEISVGKVIKLAVHMMESRALDAGVTVAVSPDINENLIIVADRRAFMQILLNLLSNAVKFTPENGLVRIECEERQDFVLIRVADNGIGIPANKLANITNPFEQVSSHYARNHQGSGLGLAITKELAEMHGGALQIESTVDVGTTVTIRLPYKAEQKFKKK